MTSTSHNLVNSYILTKPHPSYRGSMPIHFQSTNILYKVHYILLSGWQTRLHQIGLFTYYNSLATVIQYNLVYNIMVWFR